MSGVWMSNVYRNHGLGERLGTRTKMYGREWGPATSNLPVATPEELKAINLQAQGFALPRESFPEADAVYNDKMFDRVGELFNCAGFFVVREGIAKLLSNFDLGDGGLIPFPIYQSDLVTPYPGKFFILNVGSRKNTIIPEMSENVVKFAIDRETGTQYWKVRSDSCNDDVVLTRESMNGSDLWVEEVVHEKIFLSDALVSALANKGYAGDWLLQRCRIAEIA